MPLVAGATWRARPCGAWSRASRCAYGAIPRPSLFAAAQAPSRLAARHPQPSQQQQRHQLVARAEAEQPGDLQPGQPRHDPAVVATYLAAQGVDAAQLQREQPAAWAQLSLPLTQLLVAALEARKALDSRGQRLTPADLAARLVFLGVEAGLPLEEVQRRFAERPANLQFKVEGARGVLAWLRGYIPDPGRLQRVVIWQPQVLCRSASTLQTNKAGFQELFRLSDRQWADLAYGGPAVLVASPASAAAVVAWLRSEAVGATPEQVLRLFSREPGFFVLKVATLSERLEYLLQRLDIPRAKAVSLLLRCWAAFGISSSLLDGKIEALESYGFIKSEVGRLILHSAIVLGSDFEGKLRPSLATLERLLDPPGAPQERRQAVIDVVLRGVDILAANPDQLHSNWQFLRRQGLSEEQARTLLRNAPQVFARTLDGEIMRAKLAYYEEVLGIGPLEMLLHQRGYLKEGLAKVDQRVFCMERRGELLQRGDSAGGKLSWAKDSPLQFSSRFGVSQQEWAAALAEWPGSERAQQYGLVGGMKKIGAFSPDFRLGAARAKANKEGRGRDN